MSDAAPPKRDAFRDRLEAVAAGRPAPDLAHQSRPGPLSDAESALADALMSLFGQGVHDFEAVAAQLTREGVVAPQSGRTDWDTDLLQAELAAANARLDTAYAEDGYGA